MIAGIKKMRRLFKSGSVCVTGQRGRGKDLLCSNVACRSKLYRSNINYGGNFRPINFGDLDIKNDYTDLVNGTPHKYVYPYEEGADLFISDIGIYFPSQYCNELNRKYPRLPYFLALSRQLGNANVHLNVQHLPRAWDKFREQSDIYVLCRYVCKPLVKLGIVIQRITVYDKYQSCVDRCIPFALPKPGILSKKEVRLQYEIERQKYLQTYGDIRNYTLVYFNRSKYNDRHFKQLLETAEDN